MNALVAIGWTRAADFLPDTPRCVMATDGECHFVAVFETMTRPGRGKEIGNSPQGTWFEAHTAEEIDSVITHWQELPELPEDDG